MATVVVYIDEAGSPDRHHDPLANGETPLFALVGLALPLAEWRPRDRGYLRLKRQFFPELMGRPGKRDEEVEIKGRDLTGPHQKTSARRQEYNRRTLRFIEQHGGKAFAATFLKDPHNPTPSRSLYTKALQILGRTFTNIVEAPLFADSRLTVGLQLTDIVAANLYATYYDYYLRKTPGMLDYSHARPYWPLLDRIQFRSAGQIGGFQMFGFRVVDQRGQGPAQGGP